MSPQRKKKLKRIKEKELRRHAKKRASFDRSLLVGVVYPAETAFFDADAFRALQN
jgi:hypothetical protein